MQAFVRNSQHFFLPHHLISQVTHIFFPFAVHFSTSLRSRIMVTQKTVVVGAGPVGALAALYAAQRGDEVEVYELRGGMLPFLLLRSGHSLLSPLLLFSPKLHGSRFLE